MRCQSENCANRAALALTAGQTKCAGSRCLQMPSSIAAERLRCLRPGSLSSICCWILPASARASVTLSLMIGLEASENNT